MGIVLILFLSSEIIHRSLITITLPSESLFVLVFSDMVVVYRTLCLLYLLKNFVFWMSHLFGYLSLVKKGDENVMLLFVMSSKDTGFQTPKEGYVVRSFVQTLPVVDLQEVKSRLWQIDLSHSLGCPSPEPGSSWWWEGWGVKG